MRLGLCPLPRETVIDVTEKRPRGIDYGHGLGLFQEDRVRVREARLIANRSQRIEYRGEGLQHSVDVLSSWPAISERWMGRSKGLVELGRG